MMGRHAFTAALFAFLVGTSTAAMAASESDCAALDQLIREARTDFPALRTKKLEAASCSQQKRQFKCDWSFPADTFAEAQTQAARLGHCTAAQPGARMVSAKRGERAFQVNPATLVVIRGPKLDSGSWRIRLLVATSAEWD